MSLIHIASVTPSGWTVLHIFPTERISVDTRLFELESSDNGEKWDAPHSLDEHFHRQGIAICESTYTVFVDGVHYARIRPIVQEPERKAS